MTYTANPINDAALASAERDSSVRRAINDLIVARNRLHAKETANAMLLEAFAAATAAGIEPTIESIAATLAGMKISADAQTQEVRAADEQVRDAVKRHYALLLPLRNAIASAADALALEAMAARREVSSLRQPTQADEVRMEMLRAGASPSKVHELMTMLPPDPDLEKRMAAATRKVEAASIADGKAATLRALLAKTPLIDFEAVEAVAADYPVITRALAQVCDALGLAEVE